MKAQKWTRTVNGKPQTCCDQKGLGDTPEAHAWRKMIVRCEVKTNHNYKRYGARGIRVCARWHLFNHFLEDVGLRPSPRHSLDRIDNNGHYEPENVRWTLPIVQARNRRTNLRLTLHGTTRTLIEWAEITGIRRDTIQRRLKLGWTLEKALTQPLRGSL